MPHALPNRLERGPAIAELGDVPAEQFVGVMVDGPEEPAPAVFLGIESRGVVPPHLVRVRRDDRAGVGRIAIGRPEPPRRQKLMLPHHPQDPLAAHGQAAMGQPRPHLSIALPVEGRFAQDAADRGDQIDVAHPGLRPALAWRQGLTAGRTVRGAFLAPSVPRPLSRELLSIYG